MSPSASSGKAKSCGKLHRALLMQSSGVVQSFPATSESEDKLDGISRAVKLAP